MAFTRQHYERIGHILAKNNARHNMIESFAVMFEEDNPLFKKDKFIDFVADKKKELKEVV